MAKLTPAFAHSVGIAVDHRRHCNNAAYEATNVQRLTNYKTKLILFPRNGKDAKKGEIADSTAEQVKGAPEQNTELGVFAAPEVKPRCKPEKLTAEMKKFAAYRALRTLRTNRRYNGKRVLKAKAEEAAKK